MVMTEHSPFRYQALIAELHLEECHRVYDLIFARFHFDIISNLPLELAARISGYLEPCEIFAFRRVSP
jgi:hypothetical protein